MAEIDLDLVPDAVLVVDRERRLSAWNRAAAVLLGPLDGLSEPIGELFDLRDLAGTPTFRHDWPQRRTEWTFLAPSTADRGAESVVLSVSARLQGDEDDPDGAVIVARRVGDAEGMAVVAAVSHELRSPLTSIKGYTSLLLSRWDRLDDGQKLEMLEAVHHDAGRVTRLVTELLDIGRLETGGLVLRRCLVDLRELCGSVIDRLAFTYPDLECTLDFDESFPPVWADADKVEQVVTNLIENAAKYADPTGVRIVGRVEADHVSVEVEDRGDGIRSEDLPRVFTKFFRGDHGSPSGTGLGLWISRGLAEAHGGTLDVASRPGEGSGFVLSLPLDTAESTGPPRGA